MRWECEVTELSEGMTATVYDESGRMMLDRIDEPRAHMIAAAPELLDALRGLLKLTFDAYNNDPIYWAAQRAVFKAEGR